MSKQEQHAQSHEGILEAAAAEFRRAGLQKASVNQIMKNAGLTVGGFYAHFESKEELIEHAFVRMVDEAKTVFEKIPGKNRKEKIGLFLNQYLSTSHRDSQGKGCPIAALVGEVARSSDTLRTGFADGLEQLALARSEGFFGHRDPADLDAILPIIASYVGALVLARATQGSPISDRILSTTKKTLLEKYA